MPASPSSLLFSFSSVRDGFVLMIEERSLQLLLERLQSSSLKEKERWGPLVLRASLAGALPRKAKWPTYTSLVPGTPPEGCVWLVVQHVAQTSASTGQKTCSACRAVAHEGLTAASQAPGLLRAAQPHVLPSLGRAAAGGRCAFIWSSLATNYPCLKPRLARGWLAGCRTGSAPRLAQPGPQPGFPAPRGSGLVRVSHAALTANLSRKQGCSMTAASCTEGRVLFAATQLRRKELNRVESQGTDWEPGTEQDGQGVTRKRHGIRKALQRTSQSQARSVGKTAEAKLLNSLIPFPCLHWGTWFPHSGLLSTLGGYFWRLPAELGGVCRGLMHGNQGTVTWQCACNLMTMKDICLPSPEGSDCQELPKQWSNVWITTQDITWVSVHAVVQGQH